MVPQGVKYNNLKIQEEEEKTYRFFKSQILFHNGIFPSTTILFHIPFY